MFSSKVRAMVATLSCPSVTFLQVDLVVAAIMGPDLEDTFDICLLNRVAVETILLLEEFFENCFIEGLGTNQANV